MIWERGKLNILLTGYCQVLLLFSLVFYFFPVPYVAMFSVQYVAYELRIVRFPLWVLPWSLYFYIIFFLTECFWNSRYYEYDLFYFGLHLPDTPLFIILFFVFNTMDKGGKGACFLKNDTAWGHDITDQNQIGPRWQTRLDLDPQSASEMTHPEVPWQFQGTVKRPRSGQWPKSWKSPPLPQNSWNNPPTH